MYFPIANRDGKGSERARQKGLDPWWRGSIVIWGDYVVQPEPELNVRFEILRTENTYLESGLGGTLHPSTVDFLNFRLDLGRALGELAAFSTALALFEDHNNSQAEPLFNTAFGIVDTPKDVVPLSGQLARAVRYFRGANYLLLGKLIEAEQDLDAVVGNLNDVEETDLLWIAALSNLGLVAGNRGDNDVARAYCQRALDLYTLVNNPHGQAATLSNLGVVAVNLGDHATAA